MENSNPVAYLKGRGSQGGWRRNQGKRATQVSHAGKVFLVNARHMRDNTGRIEDGKTGRIESKKAEMKGNILTWQLE